MRDSVAHRVAKRLLGRLLWRDTYRCLRLPWQGAMAAALEAAPSDEQAEVRPLERAELRRYSTNAELGISSDFLDGIAERDDLCFGAFVEGKLAAYRFFALMPTAIDAYLRFVFPPRWIYAYKAFTLPQWRGRRLHRQLFVRSLAHAQDWVHGMEEPLGIVTLVLSDNHPSVAALSRLGFSQFQSFSVVRVAGRPRLVSPSGEGPTFYIELD